MIIFIYIRERGLKMKKIHYAWFVCAGCALLLFCTSGLSINAFTIYQPYILKLNNFTNSQSSMIITVRNLFSFASFLGVRFYYKYLPKRTGMAIAGALTVIGFFLFGLAEGFAAYCVAAAVVGISYGLGTMVPITIILSEWFYEKRNTAVAVCSAITGISTLGIPSLIAKLIEKIGIRYTFWIEAGIIALLILISFCLIRNHPQDKGILPYGSDKEKSVSMPSIGLNASDKLLMIPALLLIGAVMNVSYSHLTVHFTSSGYSPSEAALAVAVSGIVLTVSKILFGRLGDRKSNFFCNYVFSAILIAGLSGFIFIRRGMPVLFGSTALYSCGLSFTAVGLSVWANDLSSEKDYDKNVQLFQTLYSAGSLLFSPVPGLIADKYNGSYDRAYIMFFVFAFYVIFAVQLTYIRVNKRRRK